MTEINQYCKTITSQLKIHLKLNKIIFKKEKIKEGR